MGYPINSAGNDIYLTLSADENQGFLSSNRVNGFGLMDIYTVDFFPTPTFDCEPFENELVSIDLDLTESIDPSSAELTYQWNFDDGEILYGTSVDKIYKTPGKHVITVTIIENESGKIEEHEVIEEFSQFRGNHIQ